MENTSKVSFSCFIVGAGTLPIQCAEALLNCGHQILGIISTDPVLSTWAGSNNLPVYNSIASVRAVLTQQPFDYLFSINNENIILPNILSLTRRCAINYHDAPLPAYAGVHATSWAILGREVEHGISWHIMAERVDAGAILKQPRFAIEPCETALTLNSKCYEHAIAAFAELVEELAQGRTQPLEQDPARRSYFPRFKRPEQGAVIDWRQSAAGIDALARALDFGLYPNPLGLPKLAVGDAFYLIRGLRVYPGSTGAKPGTVLALANNELRIAATDAAIAIADIQTLSGRPLAIADWAASCGLQIGQPLPAARPDTLARIGDLNQSVAKHEAFWVDRLARAEPLPLPYAQAHSDPAGGLSFVALALSEPVQQAIESLGLSIWQALTGAFALYLARVSGKPTFDLAYSPAQLRETLLGVEHFFAGQVPWTVECPPAASFASICQRLETQRLRLVQAQTYALDLTARHPALRAGSAWQELDAPVAIAEAAAEACLALPNALALCLPPMPSNAGAALAFDPGRISPADVERMAGHLRVLLESIAASPDLPAYELPLLAEAERRQILAWSETPISLAEIGLVHAKLAEQARRRPDATAVVFAGQRLNYGELDAQANRLARHLQALGVAPGVLVGVCVERSLDMVVALAGVLKAGGAYLPLDPAYPSERLAFMLNDAAPAVLLTQEALLAALPQTQAQTVCLDRDGPLIAALSAEAPANAAGADDLAYVIYTSGSTGTPKGVLLEHKGLANVIAAQRQLLGLSHDDRVLQFASLNFDAASSEIWMALCSGAALYVGSREDLAPGEPLRDFLERHAISVATPTPSTLAATPYAELPALRVLGVAGEACPAALAALWAVGRGFFNLYGPTEASICATATPWAGPATLAPPIGRPIANVRVFLLDAFGQPVPTGVVGEIHIGGVQVARGYLNRPELTAEKFVTIDLGEGSERVYKTGDLARWLPDGNLEFLGRADGQVKLRGFRIELGEIESALVRHPAVREVAVLAREDRLGQQRLVAYVVSTVTDGGEALSPDIVHAQLAAFLKASLPDYMIPSAYVLLDALPLTANGKLDRAALPAPEAAQTAHYAPPQTPAEAALAAAWRDVLGLERVGRLDNFFALGGHSLFATQVASRLRQSLGLDVPIGALFETPVLAELAARLETGQRESGLSTLPSADRSQPLPLSFAQQRLWFLDQMGVGFAYNIPLPLRLRGALDAAALRLALGEIVRRHESLRTTFAKHDGQPVQIIHLDAAVELPLLDLSHLPEAAREAEAQAQAQAESQRPFDLRVDLMLRVRLLRLGAGEHVLLLSLHHIAADGWSVEVLVGELAALYAAFTQGQPSPLPPLAVQYADFAVWQRHWLQGEVLERQLAYWKARLDGAPALLELPTDRPRPAVESFRGAELPVHFGAALADKLKAISRDASTTLFTTLLAAYQVLLARHSSRDDIVVGVPAANRNRLEIEPLIGFFVNSLALRADLSGNPSFRQVLEQVKRIAHEAQDHQDLPFERLVDELKVERSLGYNPVVQIMFALQTAQIERLALPDLEVSPFASPRALVRLDLELHLWDRADGLSGYCAYATDLFDAATIARMMGHFGVLLDAIAAAPDRPVRDLPLLTAAERLQILIDWRSTRTTLPATPLVHTELAEQARRRPDATAVVFAGQRLNYGELDAQANRLARHLQALGVGPGVLVGVCVERSLDMVVALAGVLKAGGAYLPLDPAYPSERLAFMLNDAAPAVLLTQESWLSVLPETKAQSVCLNRDGPLIAALSAEAPANAAGADDLAYVIYTSGSTGTPKGVLLEHKGLANVIAAQRQLLGLSHDDRVLQFASLNFDAATWEICGALCAGAALHVGSREDIAPGEPLRDFLERHAISVATLTPSTLAATPYAELPALRVLNVAGEACPAALAALWAVGRRFFNLYGPTEASICATAMPWAGAAALAPPIGRPIANVRVYLLDAQGQPVPAGVAGEIHIGGVQVARGYWNRPELTAEKFVTITVGEGGERVYKTGDLARWLPDGNIEFLGRIDHQVKLRGFRIELGEIESALARHPSVREVAVLAREDAPGDKRLVVYLVPGEVDEETSAKHVSEWQTLYEDTYQQSLAADGDRTLNLYGWNSSYTGQSIPDAVMREWVEATVADIRALNPTRILEIGCGSGLLLARLAPGCERYVGLDSAAAALDSIRQAGPAIEGFERVSLLQRMADDLSGLEGETFDCVVINSVIQYFPSVDYLLRVIEGAAAKVRDGGFLFVGDVRSYPLLEAYHASVQAYRAEAGTTRAELRQRVQEHLADEEELTVDPAFFHALPGQIPRISGVRVSLKRGRDHNELTRFRYQAALRVGAAVPAVAYMAWQDWQPGQTLADISARLRGGHSTVLALRGVANARLRDEAKTLDWLAAGGPPTLGRLREARVDAGIDPEDLWDLAEASGYAVRIGCSTQGLPGAMDVVFHRPGADVDGYAVQAAPRPWHRYANNPLLGKLRRALIPKLRAGLQARLPDYMVPSAFVLLDALPLTPNGKLDRAALPAPGASVGAAEFAAPQTPAEQALAAIWAEVLGVERVGRADNFFALGGHSLLATQVASRLRHALHVDLPIRAVFEHATLQALAVELDEALAARSAHTAYLAPEQAAGEDEMELLI